MGVWSVGTVEVYLWYLRVRLDGICLTIHRGTGVLSGTPCPVGGVENFPVDC